MKFKNQKQDRLEVNAGGGTFENKYASGSNVGGRVGYTKQLDDESSIRGGVSGYTSSAKVDTPEGAKKINKSNITGLDLSYNKDNSSYGIDVRKEGKEGKDTKLMLKYTKSFAKGGLVKANCGASVPPAQKAKK
jgi:hypothetical protein